MDSVSNCKQLIYNTNFTNDIAVNILQPIFRMFWLERQGNCVILVDDNVNHDAFRCFAFQKSVYTELAVRFGWSSQILSSVSEYNCLKQFTVRTNSGLYFMHLSDLDSDTAGFPIIFTYQPPIFNVNNWFCW